MNRLLEEESKVKHSGDTMFNFNLPSYNFTVDLPSRGLYYQETHPLFQKEYIELKHVTGQEEAILTNKDYIKKGIVLDKFLQALFVDKRLIFPDIYSEILLADKFAMLIDARKSAYSKDYKVEVTCPACESKLVHSFDLTKIKIKGGYEDLSQEEKDKFIRLNHNCFRMKLPACELNVSVKLNSVRDEVSLFAKAKKLAKTDVLTFKDQFIDQLVDIEGNSALDAKDYFLDKAPAIDLLYLRVQAEKLNPETELTQDFVCSNSKCEHVEKDFDVPVTQNFLFPHLKIHKS